MGEHTIQDPTTDIVSYLRELIAVPTVSPPGETSEMAAYLSNAFAAMGYSTETASAVPGLDNVVARMGSGSPSLVFNVHVDTVDAGDLSRWSHPPLEATRVGDHIFGLGAANCKGSGAVQLWLANKVAQRGGPAQGEVLFTFVTDEENLGPNGMRFLREQGIVKPDMLLLGAPTENSLITTERGVLWVEITTTGRSAHAGQPEDGDNAILRMIRIVSRLDKEMASRLSHRVEGDMRSTINIGQFHGGLNTNVVPSQCVTQVDRRLLPSETVDEAFAEIGSIVESVGEPESEVRVERLRGTNGFRGDAGGQLVASLSSAIHAVTGSPAGFSTAIGVSDGRYFADDDVEIVNFGPGVGTEGHASNESVSIESLRSSALILDRTFSDLMGYAA